MRRFLTFIAAGALVVSLQVPTPAQTRADLSAIPPMLEDVPPLAQPETRQTQGPKVQKQKAKRIAKTKTRRKKAARKTRLGLKSKRKTTAITKKRRCRTVRKKGIIAAPKSRPARNRT